MSTWQDPSRTWCECTSLHLMRSLTDSVLRYLSSYGNDGPALEAIYEGYPPATGAPCILNSLHTTGCVGYQPPKSNYYPWRCLCFGFSQIMRTLPFLLITLHFSQIGFTDDLTFMWDPPFIHCFAFVCTAQIPVLRLLPRLISVFLHKIPGKRAYILYHQPSSKVNREF